MTAGTAILLQLWTHTRTEQITSYYESYVSDGFDKAFDVAVSVLFTSQATAIIEELENDLITHNPHAQSLADYIRKVKSI